jgi:glycosyltransferase involved in cell wall biosynthesis
MKPPVVAFFGSLISGGVPRGALRLFRAMADELALRDDIEFVCLGNRLSDPSDPLGCLFERLDGLTFMQFLDDRCNLEVVEDLSLSATVFAEPQAVRRKSTFAALRSFRRTKDYRWRDTPRRVKAELRRIKRRYLMPWLQFLLDILPSSRIPASSPPPAPAQAAKPPSRRTKPFSNADIKANVISLEQVDVVLDFWWFHTPVTNPLIGQYRPPGLRVLSWFLDAIPLRIPPWQPGMIPTGEYRGHIQGHLEAADEIVAISNSARDDIRTFFPHVGSKPIHVVPCGIHESDKRSAGFGADHVRNSLRLVDHLPTFVVIGAHEPSKNVANTLLALIALSKTLDAELQVFVVGSLSTRDIATLLGPAAMQLEGRVRVVLATAVSDLVKQAVLCYATALVYVSKWEGFGIPPLEAMAVGTRVVLSDIAPLREACHGIGEFCDPYDPKDIAAAILRVMRQPAHEVAAYAAKARARADQYTWARAADRLCDIIHALPAKKEAAEAKPAEDASPRFRPGRTVATRQT